MAARDKETRLEEAEEEVGAEVADDAAAEEEEHAVGEEEAADEGVGAAGGPPAFAAGPAVGVPVPVAPPLVNPGAPRMQALASFGAAASCSLWEVAAAEGQGVSDARVAIKARQRELAAQSRRLSMDLHNENRKRQRRMDKARGLNDADLMEILRERAAKDEKGKAKKRKAKAKPKAGLPRALVARSRSCHRAATHVALCASVRTKAKYVRFSVDKQLPLLK